jgi:cytochrome c oxidase subunit 2
VRRRDLTHLLIAFGISSAVGIAAGLAIHWFPNSASTQAHQIDTVYKVLLVASIPMFALVESVVVLAIIKFRMRPGQEEQDGPPIHGNTRLEIVWTAIPALLMVGLCSYAYVELRNIEKHHPNELKVNVIGQQFAWRFEYPQGNGKVAKSTDLYLPCDPPAGATPHEGQACTGRPVLFRETAEDVIHSFWVPAFRMKLDAVPGITTDLRVTPKRIGDFAIVCAELCGLGHSTMRSTVHVVPTKKFNSWLQQRLQVAQAVGGGGGGGGSSGGGAAQPKPSAALGRKTFLSSEAGCGACHTLADAGTKGTTGPDLDRGLKGKSSDFIHESIVKPDADITPGYPAGIMPQDFAQRLSPAQIDSLVLYLSQVTK